MADLTFSLVYELVRNGLISGLGSGPTSYAIGRVLTLILGGNDGQEQLERLNAIQKQVDAIATVVNAIQQDIEHLESQLQIDTTEIESYINQAAIAESIAAIEQHYLDLDSLVKQTINGADAKERGKEFSKNVLEAWDIPTKVFAIANALVGSEGVNKSLLNSWTDYLILKVKAAPASGELLKAYQLLEGWFQQQLHHQYKGIILAGSAKCATSSINASCPDAQAYIDEVEQLLLAQADLFLSCVERLVLSQYKMTSLTATPDFPIDAGAIFQSADFLTGTLRHQAPGLSGRCFTQQRFVNKTARTGPSLRPNSQFPASEGTLVAIPEDYRANWLHCVEISNTMQLTDYSNSELQVVRYYWPWPQTPPPANVPLKVDNGFRVTSYANRIDVVPAYYDRATGTKIDRQDQPGDQAVLYANFVDMSSTVENLSDLLNWHFHMPSGYTGTPMDNYMTIESSTSNPPLGAHLKATYKPPPPSMSGPTLSATTYTGTITADPIAVQGAQARNLNFLVGGHLTSIAAAGKTTWGQEVMRSTSSVLMTVNGLPLFEHSNTSAGQNLEGPFSNSLAVSVQGSTALSVVIDYMLAVDPTAGTPYLGDDPKPEGETTFYIDFFRCAW